ncbi:SMI1/KNR4 family protein [Actinomadura coerulea]|uniref:SMI1/KNR4 family protein n=1 Tax=Actinomadura coerulea TaxID=46159 RepID=UPI00341D855D
MDQIRKAWRRIERWVDSESELPPVKEMFNPPARPPEIDAAERALDHSFPAPYRASLLVHERSGRGRRRAAAVAAGRNVSADAAGDRGIVARGAAFENKRFFGELPEEDTGEFDRIHDFPAVTAVERLSIAQNEGISYMYLDLLPGLAGDSGQVIYTKNECSFSVAGADFAEFLSRYADLLERGVLRYDIETYSCMVPADEQDSWEELFRPSIEREA